MSRLQKILLLAYASTAIALPSLAQFDQVYVVGTLGAMWWQKPALASTTYNPGYIYNTARSPTPIAPLFVTDRVSHDSSSPDTGLLFSAGLGTYWTETVRIEAVFVKPPIVKATASISDSQYGSATTYYKGSLTAKISAIEARAYVDIYETCEFCKLYVGGGLGWSQVKVDLSTSGSGAPGVSSSSGNRNNLTWMIGIGSTFEVYKGVKLGAEFDFKDFGYVSHPVNTSSRINFRGYTFAGKVMFDI